MRLFSKPLVAMGTCMLFVSVAFFACKKDNTGTGNTNIPEGKMKFSVYLTDGPYDFEKVLIDIRQVAVKLDTCQRNDDEDRDQPGCDEDHDQRNSDCEIWDTLAIRPGVYDILQLRNGLDTLLASDFLLSGKIKRIKFTLGDNNSVTVDGTDHPLQLVNDQHFVYLNLKREHLDELSSDNFQLFLDFNLSHSIKFYNGKYWIKPVLKPFSHRNSGEIRGKVRPVHSFGIIKAFNGTDTAFAMPWSEGEFKLRGLDGGTYSLFIEGRNGYRDTTITNISVTKNKDTDVGTIELHQ
ncbi:MAG: DUF4382 domain-containing protein [Ferruginibacter sp.]